MGQVGHGVSQLIGKLPGVAGETAESDARDAGRLAGALRGLYSGTHARLSDTPHAVWRDGGAVQGLSQLAAHSLTLSHKGEKSGREEDWALGLPRGTLPAEAVPAGSTVSSTVGGATGGTGRPAIPPNCPARSLASFLAVDAATAAALQASAGNAAAAAATSGSSVHAGVASLLPLGSTGALPSQGAATGAVGAPGGRETDGPKATAADPFDFLGIGATASTGATAGGWGAPMAGHDDPFGFGLDGGGTGGAGGTGLGASFWDSDDDDDGSSVAGSTTAASRRYKIQIRAKGETPSVAPLPDLKEAAKSLRLNVPPVPSAGVLVASSGTGLTPTASISKFGNDSSASIAKSGNSSTTALQGLEGLSPALAAGMPGASGLSPALAVGMGMQLKPPAPTPTPAAVNSTPTAPPAPSGFSSHGLSPALAAGMSPIGLSPALAAGLSPAFTAGLSPALAAGMSQPSHPAPAVAPLITPGPMAGVTGGIDALLAAPQSNPPPADALYHAAVGAMEGGDFARAGAAFARLMAVLREEEARGVTTGDVCVTLSSV